MTLRKTVIWFARFLLCVSGVAALWLVLASGTGDGTFATIFLIVLTFVGCVAFVAGQATEPERRP